MLTHECSAANKLTALLLSRKNKMFTHLLIYIENRHSNFEYIADQ